MQGHNALTVDVEDYFQVEAFAGIIDRGEWDAFPSRVVRNTERLLDLFAEAGVSGTFFTLGWIAERHPELVRRIVRDGHELASHGSDHYRIDQQSPEEFRDDIRRSKALLEDIGGIAVAGYRAPTFSVGVRSRWAHAILAEEGFRYSSSVYPVAHDLYGVPDAPRQPFCPLPGFVEIPMTTLRLFGRNFPTSGGGWFRLLPYAVTRTALRRAGKELRAACVFTCTRGKSTPASRASSRRRCAPGCATTSISAAPRTGCADCCAIFAGPEWIASSWTGRPCNHH